MPAMITVIGSANIDLTVRSVRLPLPGETIVGTGFQRHFGGKGANQAVAAARLGANVRFIGKIGPDTHGKECREQLSREGVDVSHLLESASSPTGTAVILVDEAGQNSIVVVPGANGDLTPAEVKNAKEAIRDSQFLVAQLEVPVPAVLEAFRVANAGHVVTILNPAPAIAIPDELLKRSEVCTPNETELHLLTGMPVGNIEEIEAAARALRKRGAREVVVTLGERGVFTLDGFGAKHLPAVPVQAVDTSGAGDAFTGALAVFLAEGCPIREAIRRAQHLAAISVTRMGTQASFPTRAESLA